jgi:hypothetical protein
MCVTKDKLDHFKEKFAEKFYRFSCQNDQIRIRYNYTGSGRTTLPEYEENKKKLF